jgi:hypothetical protein
MKKITLTIIIAVYLLVGIVNADTYTWVGGTGFDIWSIDANWDVGTAPVIADNVVIGGTAEVTYGGLNHLERGGQTTLNGTAHLIIEPGKRFLNGRNSGADFVINDAGRLTVQNAEYFIVATNSAGTLTQNGGSVVANVSRGFQLTDNTNVVAAYYLYGGTLEANLTGVSDENWFRSIGKSGNDVFHIDGGDAIFNGVSGRRFYIQRGGQLVIDSGSASFNDLSRLTAGRTLPGIASITLNDGELNYTSTNEDFSAIIIGDYASGRLYINGGEFNISIAGEDKRGFFVGYGTAGSGIVEQTAGDVDMDGIIATLCQPGSDSGKYKISGGSLHVSRMVLNPNSEFNVAGSASSSITIQEFVAEQGNALLSIDLDAGGCSLIQVGTTENDPNYAGGAWVDNLRIETNTLSGFNGTIGDKYDVLWSANGGITGLESVVFESKGLAKFELSLVDATANGYPSGELLQLTTLEVLELDPRNADFNRDGSVDLLDYRLLAGVWLENL